MNGLDERDQRRPLARLDVNLVALEKNFRVIQHAARPAEAAAVVKADAYGLGMLPVARRLIGAGCKKLFVATFEEALALRAAERHVRIFVLEGVDAGCEEMFAANSLTPVLNTLDQVRRWSPMNRRVALQIDTGMSRMGLSPADVETLANDRGLLDTLQLEYVMTHLACADEADHVNNIEQIKLFERLRRRLPIARTSIANSAGTFLGAEHRGDLIRAGIALYGGNPFVDRQNGFRPVATLSGKVLQVRTIEQATSVGYGATHVARVGDRLATVGIGYADGYPRSLGNRAFVWAAGARVPVVGRVSMDYLVIDATTLPDGVLAPGDYVELFGEHVHLDEVAAAAGTISYEILTGIGRRVERHYREQ